MITAQSYERCLQNKNAFDRMPAMQKIMLNIFIVMIAVVLLAGCQHLMEAPKIIWGNSLKELENARVRADKKTYLCRFEDCYAAILTLDRNYPVKPYTEKFCEVFLKDPVRGVIVIMGLKDAIDTTEVGIFLTEQDNASLDVEVVSSSSSAQEKAAQAVFAELDKRFFKAITR
ncbi:MAG TPA: hypothetical protein PLH56_06265 [Candidatus Omnitrophota bacterium]|nr:hypothetical protein [Candidatus Omnitrophota bacterium]